MSDRRYCGYTVEALRELTDYSDTAEIGMDDIFGDDAHAAGVIRELLDEIYRLRNKL